MTSKTTTGDVARPVPTFAAFANPGELDAWLRRHHASAEELWVRIHRTGSGVPSVTWNDCVVAALAVGWIDGKRTALDATSFLQRLTPRRRGSTWSARNRAHALRLIAEERMQPTGLAQVDAARRDGRWDAAYVGSADMVMPEDFLAALAASPAADAFYDGLDRGNRYAIYHRLQTAKRPETRTRRMGLILAQLERGERFR